MVKRRYNLKIKLTEKRNDCNGRIGEVLVSFKASECIFDQKQKLKSKIQGMKSKPNWEHIIAHMTDIRAEEH